MKSENGDSLIESFPFSYFIFLLYDNKLRLSRFGFYFLAELLRHVCDDVLQSSGWLKAD